MNVSIEFHLINKFCESSKVIFVKLNWTFFFIGSSLITSLISLYKRTNKINLRKEFFNVSIDELEVLVQEIEPTAEFNKTMVAEQYRQTLSINEEDKILI